MDEKHRQYCIKLGNPYMGENYNKPEFRTETIDSSWIPQDAIKEENWLKNSKKFTN
ncbi:MAG: hypothetical protein GX682_05985 [Clostridiaceae bacterium]|nr:hypothetical protein [Clostridiaceae bacterium]